jgi:two-component system response regulator HupR/HoxA
MQSRYRDFPILYVHDDPRTLTVLRYLLGEQFTIYSATTLDEVLQVLARERVALLLCEHRMRGVAAGLEICASVRDVQPDVPRIVTTTHEERVLAVDAVSAGLITRCVLKPWHDPDFIDLMRSTVEACAERSTKR